MAATIASGGVNPSTGEQVVDQVSCRCALVVMATAGFMKLQRMAVHHWFLRARVVSVAGSSWCRPVRAGSASSPRGSMQWQQCEGPACRRLLHQLGLDLFVSAPETESRVVIATGLQPSAPLSTRRLRVLDWSRWTGDGGTVLQGVGQ